MKSQRKKNIKIKNSSPVCYAEDDEIRPEYRIIIKTSLHKKGKN